MRRRTAGAALMLVIWYGLGDTVTTYYIFTDPTLVETNPIVLVLYEYGGFVAFVAVKILFIGGVLATIPLVGHAATSETVQSLAGRYEVLAYLPRVIAVTPLIACSVIGAMGLFATVNNLILIL